MKDTEIMNIYNEREKGFSLIELIIVVTIIGIISMIAVPNLIKSRQAANEASAISSLGLIYRAEMNYQLSRGNGNFADIPTLYSNNFIDITIGTPPHTKSGYQFEVDTYPASSGVVAKFDLRARPTLHVLVSNITGTGSKDFGTNEAGGYYQTSDNTPVTFDINTRQPTGTAILYDR